MQSTVELQNISLSRMQFQCLDALPRAFNILSTSTVSICVISVEKDLVRCSQMAIIATWENCGDAKIT